MTEKGNGIDTDYDVWDDTDGSDYAPSKDGDTTTSESGSSVISSMYDDLERSDDDIFTNIAYGKEQAVYSNDHIKQIDQTANAEGHH